MSSYSMESSVALDRARMPGYGGGNSMNHSGSSMTNHGMYTSRPSAELTQGQGLGRSLTHDPLDGKTHVLYVMYDEHGKVNADCAQAVEYAKHLTCVLVQDALKLAERPLWLTVVPTLANLQAKTGNTGPDSVQELLMLCQHQDQMHTMGIAQPLQRDSNGFPAYAQLGSGTTNSAMLTVGSVAGLNQDPSRYQDGKLEPIRANEAIASLLEQRQQRKAYTGIPF
jgi:hypothetical protein